MDNTKINMLNRFVVNCICKFWLILNRINSYIYIPEEQMSLCPEHHVWIQQCFLYQIRAHAAVYSIFQSPSVSLSKHMAQA